MPIGNIEHVLLFDNLDIAAGDLSDKVKVREFNSFCIYGNILSGTGDIEILTSADGSAFFFTNESITISHGGGGGGGGGGGHGGGDFYGRFFTETEYVRVRVDSDFSGCTMLFSAKRIV
jgi:hypothetical protein